MAHYKKGLGLSLQFKSTWVVCAWGYDFRRQGWQETTLIHQDQFIKLQTD